MNIIESLEEFEYYKKLMLEECKNKTCSACGCTKIGVSHWGMFEGKKDLYYYCKECELTYSFMDNMPCEEEIDR